MAKLLRIERAITWIARTLIANRDSNPTPEGVIDQILPNVDIFGSQRIEQLRFATVTGAPAGIEATHGPVEAGSVRQYLSMEYSTDDSGVGSPRRLRPGRVVPVASGFPFAGLADEKLAPAGEFFAVRNFTVGPGGFAAVTADAMSGGAVITLSLLWVETPVGEYLRSVQ